MKHAKKVALIDSRLVESLLAQQRQPTTSTTPGRRHGERPQAYGSARTGRGAIVQSDVVLLQ